MSSFGVTTFTWPLRHSPAAEKCRKSTMFRVSVSKHSKMCLRKSLSKRMKKQQFFVYAEHALWPFNLVSKDSLGWSGMGIFLVMYSPRPFLWYAARLHSLSTLGNIAIDDLDLHLTRTPYSSRVLLQKTNCNVLRCSSTRWYMSDKIPLWGPRTASWEPVYMTCGTLHTLKSTN